MFHVDVKMKRLGIRFKNDSCKYSSAFWDKVQLWLKEGNVVDLNLSFIDIKYGNYEEDGKKVFWINNLLLLAKNFIHKCRLFLNDSFQ